MLTPLSRTGRALGPGLLLTLALAVTGCVSTPQGAQGQAGASLDPEEARLQSAPAAEREALAAAQREAEAAAAAVPTSRRLVERRFLEAKLGSEEAASAAAFLKAARVRAELAQKFGQESGLESAPVLTLLERAELASRQADVRGRLARHRHEHAQALVPVTQAKAEAARRKVGVARERALAATRPGVDSVAYPPLADAQARLAAAEADLARAEAAAVRRQADVETAQYDLQRLGAPVALTAVPGSGTWPALGASSATAAPATGSTGAAASPARAPAPAPARAPAPATARQAPPEPAALAEPGPTGGAVLFEPSGSATRPR